MALITSRPGQNMQGATRVSPGVYRTRNAPAPRVKQANPQFNFETTLRSQMNSAKPASSQYWQRRALLNDYLESTGKKVNRTKEESAFQGKSDIKEAELRARVGAAKGTSGYNAAQQALSSYLASKQTVNTQPVPNPEPKPADPGVVNPPAPVDYGFKSAYDFMPKDLGQNPTYKWAAQEGQRLLDRKLASMGQLNSSAAVEATNKLSDQLTASEYSRALDVAQNDAGRYNTQSLAEADRGERSGNENWNRLYQLLSLANASDPYSSAVSQSNSQNDLYGQLAKTIAETMQSGAARRVGGGGGGGGSSMPPFAPPPQLPNTTGTSAANLAVNRTNTAELVNSIPAITNMIAGLFS